MQTSNEVWASKTSDFKEREAMCVLRLFFQRKERDLLTPFSDA